MFFFCGTFSHMFWCSSVDGVYSVVTMWPKYETFGGGSLFNYTIMMINLCLIGGWHPEGSPSR